MSSGRANDGRDVSLLARARELQDLGEWSADALAVNDAILSEIPDDLTARIRRARCLRALGRIEQALRALEDLLDTHPLDSVVKSQHAKTAKLDAARRRAAGVMSRSSQELFDAVEQAKRDERDIDFQIEGRRLLARRDRTAEAACALGAAQRRAGDTDAASMTSKHSCDRCSHAIQAAATPRSGWRACSWTASSARAGASSSLRPSRSSTRCGRAATATTP